MSTHRGIVLRAHSGTYAVLDEVVVASCRARRRLERPTPDHPEFPVPGDEVGWRPLGGSASHREGIIETVYPRRSEIARSRFGSKHVVVANLDRFVVVVPVRDPALDRGLLDRLLAVAERDHIETLICLHKVDLVEPESVQSIGRVYEAAGYTVLYTSAVSGEGVAELRAALAGHVTAFMGPSGAGKSRLIGLLQPGLELRLGSVSEKSRQGRHTTTRVDLHRTDFGALLADTPGVRDFGIWQLAPEDLGDLFPEFRAVHSRCHFATCTHLSEPDCAVKQAVENGAIDTGRYASYRAFFEDLQGAATPHVDREGRRKGRRG